VHLCREMLRNFIAQNGQIRADPGDSSRPSSRLVSNIDIWYDITAGMYATTCYQFLIRKGAGIWRLK
ncbi:MAG: hypothetical protein VXY20_09650, partial [Pseudomonadota bacterium]|nr:hypothetical protein [Pseudomonadota bacterium]